jgi:hypothetical protein
MMNERIRELAKEAKLTTELWNNPEPFVIYKEDVNYPGGLEKFAELIIKECASVSSMFSIENKSIHPDIDPKAMPMANRVVYHSTCQCVAKEIKEHFGVDQ